jgi:hypothetical protein
MPHESDGLIVHRLLKPDNVWREHPVNIRGPVPKKADLLLVGLNRKRRDSAPATLVAVEVKKDAKLHNDPIKVLRYCAALRKRYPNWRVVPLVVAMSLRTDGASKLT